MSFSSQVDSEEAQKEGVTGGHMVQMGPDRQQQQSLMTHPFAISSIFARNGPSLQIKRKQKRPQRVTRPLAEPKPCRSI